MTIIVSGSSCEKLAQTLSVYLNLKHTRAKITRFCDCEMAVAIPANLQKEDVLIVHSTSIPVHDHLMELLFMIDAVKSAGCNRIILLISYFGYARQDKRLSKKSSCGLRVVANLLSSSGADCVVIVDPHFENIKNLFGMKFYSIDVTQLFAQHIGKVDVVVAPDKGAIKRAEKLAFFLNADLAIIEKKRNTASGLDMNMTQGDVCEKDCVIFDDIADSAKTLYYACNLLNAKGAKTIQAAFTHPVLANENAKNILNSCFQKIFTTNTITQNLSSPFFCVLDIAVSVGDFLKSKNILNIFL